MTPSKTTQQVSKLQEGAVLDHLRAGTALRALRVLNLPADQTVMIGMNLVSKRLDKKDIIKIEGYAVTEEQAAKVALISPDATLSIIHDYKVVEKYDLKPPERFTGLLRCTNPACIVHDEDVPAAFVVERHDPISVRCEYCERSISADHFEFA